mmetsp:Transcript_4941/g.14793  ORF Transcript_4941/g.14793 Transcript_4941/m.14793 type:complete len:256 (-) Transcript_4941:66-833(-)
MDAVILHELVVLDLIRVRARDLEELLEALPRAIVRAVGAHHIEFVQAKVLFDTPQGLDLAAHPDEEELLDATRLHLRQNLKVRGERRLHPPCLNHLLFRHRDAWLRLQLVFGVALDAHYRLDHAGPQHLDGDGRDDAGPLRALHARRELAERHVLVHPKGDFIRLPEVPLPAVHLFLELVDPRHPVPDEAASLLHLRHVVRVTQAASRAHVPCRIHGILRRGYPLHTLLESKVETTFIALFQGRSHRATTPPPPS